MKETAAHFFERMAKQDIEDRVLAMQQCERKRNNSKISFHSSFLIISGLFLAVAAFILVARP